MTGRQQRTSYADRAWHTAVAIGENTRIGRDTYRVRFACPQIARRILPGRASAHQERDGDSSH